MKKVRVVAVFVVVLVCMSMLFAAGTKETGTAAQEKVKITVWGPLENYSDVEKASWIFCVEEFKRRYPEIEIVSVFSPAGTDYRQQYDKALMAGEAPTVTNLLPYVDVQTRAANGMIADISSFINNWDLRKQGKVNTAMMKLSSTKASGMVLWTTSTSLVPYTTRMRWKPVVEVLPNFQKLGLNLLLSARK